MTLEVEGDEMRRAGGPFGDHAAVAIVGNSRADVAREALKIARVESLSRPVLLVDLLGQGSGIGSMTGDDDLHGVSDASRYGVSLGRVARAVPNADSLFVVSGGVESPLADDVLSDHMWGSWSDQCRRAGALLVVAAPADLPSVCMAIDQLDGLVMIGDAVAPRTLAPVIGRVPTPLSGTVVTPPSRPTTTAEKAAVRIEYTRRTPRLLMTAVGALGLATLAGGAWWLNARVNQPAIAASNMAVATPIVMPGDPAPTPDATAPSSIVAATAPWSVEVASVNTYRGAMARVRQVLDSLPVPTFAATHPGGGSATWYRLLAGAFPSADQADSLLAVLRSRGVLGPDAGRVVEAPLAWLLEENVMEEQLMVRLFGWRQQGLPAYSLVTADGSHRIYFGAFQDEAEARLLTPALDSLNLYATLTKRIGSVR